MNRIMTTNETASFPFAVAGHRFVAACHIETRTESSRFEQKATWSLYSETYDGELLETRTVTTFRKPYRETLERLKVDAHNAAIIWMHGDE